MHQPNAHTPLTRGAAAFLVVALSGALAHAQEPATDSSTESARQERPRAYLIHLRDGRVLRAQALETADGWQIRQGGDWTLLPDAIVDRAIPESDVKKEARKLERAAGKDPVRRVAYADWLLGSGLVEEAVSTLDRVLEADPDQPDALELLARSDIPVSLPPLENLDAFLVASAKAGPAVRELATQRLKAADEIPDLREKLRGELLGKSPRRRSFAALALRRIMPGQEVQALLSRAVLDASQDVRVGASLALKDVGDPAVIVPVVRALESKHDTVRKNAIEALATMNYTEAVRPLYTHLVNLQSGGAGRVPHSHIFVGRQFAYVQDFDVEVAQFAAIADPIINVGIEGVVLDAGVTGVQEYVIQTERATARRALSSLTGASPGNTTAAWQRWWAANGDAWQTGSSPTGPTSSPASREN